MPSQPVGDGHVAAPLAAAPSTGPTGPTVVRHPLAATMLSALRDHTTPAPLFRLLTKRLALVLTIEATRCLPMRETTVVTPLGSAAGSAFAAPLVAVPILRAGLGMLEAVTELFPDVAVGYIGLERDHATFKPSAYYTKLPPMAQATVLLLDPMLATGGSASAACSSLAGEAPGSVTLLSVVAAPEGLDRLARDHPGVRVVTAAVDDGLDENAYIVPGLGDFGDRLFGT
ncbi:MAG: uracil phosphoribosyltransferase [Acidimicrobiales bacterium]